MSEVYTVSTYHGTEVFIDGDGRASHGLADEPGLSYLVRVSAFKAVLCRHLERTSSYRFLPLIVRPLGLGHEFALYVHSSGSPLTAEPLATPRSVLASNRTRVSGWETFQLKPVSVPAAIAAHPILYKVVRGELGVVDGAIATGDDSLARSLALLDLPSHPAELSRHIQGSILLAKLRGYEDHWLGQSIPDLVAWLENRSTNRSQRHIGPEYDWLAAYDHSPDRPTFKANMMLRASVRPRYRACILATARNEGVYLLEWIAHHRKLGFEHFFIYSNDNEDGSDLILESLSNAGIITLIRNELLSSVSPQVKAYGHALGMLPQILDYEWCLIIDIDEFFGLDTDLFPDVRQYLAWQQAVEGDAIALNWIWFGTFGVRTYQHDQLLTRRFYQRRPGVDKHIKCMVRPNSFFHSHPHYPKSIKGHSVFRDAAGDNYEGWPEEFAFSKKPLETPAWIAHYWSKSLDEVLAKFSRGRGDMAMTGRPAPVSLLSDIGRRVLQAERDSGSEDDRRLIELVPDLEAEIAHLRALPGVRHAEQLTETEFLRLIAHLRQGILAVNPASIANDSDAMSALSLFLGEQIDVAGESAGSAA